MRYKTAGNAEDEFEPRSSVLKNRLGIRSKRKMDAKEHEALLRTQERFFNSVAAGLKFDAALVLEIHAHFFGALYSWAGRYRTVNISKEGFTWPPSSLVAQNMRAFEEDILLKDTPCRAGSLEKVAEAMAAVHADLLLIHPFREGNGRVARLLIGMMALQAGFPPPDFAFRAAKNRKRYIEAVRAGYVGNRRLLADLIAKAIRRAEEKTKNL